MQAAINRFVGRLALHMPPKIRARVLYLTWLIGIRQTIPRDIINDVRVVENNEPMVDISHDGSLFFSEELKRKPILVREGTHKRLIAASSLLPPGYKLKLYDAFRSLDEQRASWIQRLNETRLEHPTLSEDAIIRLTGVKVANPTKGYGGHQTGGAVDISLCTERGEDIDMGSIVAQYDERTSTFSRSINSTQRANRRLLFDVMTRSGFANYPAEWWHYCYGDRMWAAYSRTGCALYGMVSQ